MQETKLEIRSKEGKAVTLPLVEAHTLVVGSGAAGLNAALQLHAQGLPDVLIVTEGLQQGTSINTGSDKQTYYKLSLYGAEADSPLAMAETYFQGGSMHGDLALVEAALSARAFMHLVARGVSFPQDLYGQFVGYKTDHDPRQRATSIGPYTSREMCRALIEGVQEAKIPVREGRTAVRLLVGDGADGRRAFGIVAVGEEGELEAYIAENVIFAVGGPGALYRMSVYPAVHTGGIGLALLEGVRARNLPESQYGLASVAFRWNVSGTYMQVIPRFISTGPDGRSDEREFLREAFESPGKMNSQVFLKGYQWPFDARKVLGGSSLIDLLVYRETVEGGRRVFLDYRRNPDGFRFEDLSDEARAYLARSGALQATPIERLQAMNPPAVALYAEHGIPLDREPLEIAVCAQHNNGGLAANRWWESENVRHLFPVGEVNGSHGVYRPGGAALNAGQVGGFRAADFIAHRYAGWTMDRRQSRVAAAEAAGALGDWLQRSEQAPCAWQEERREFQDRMTRAGAHVRSLETLEEEVPRAWEQWRRVEQKGCGGNPGRDKVEALKTRYLCFAHAVYLDAIRFALASGVGSRGSAIVLTPDGVGIHPALGSRWRMATEDERFREQVLETTVVGNGTVRHAWKPRRPLPAADAWFETAWTRFREGKIYEDSEELSTT